MQATNPTPAAPSLLVIGAGLAGACSARALAQAGWAVQVLDAAPAPAQGASALPLGLMAEKKGAAAKRHAADIGPDWERFGLACTRRWLEDLSRLGLLQRGLDWQACGSAESLDFDQKKPHKQPASNPSWQWQADACWVKPARLVAACLAQPGIACMWQAQVAHIGAQGAGWLVQLKDGRSLYADALVLAASVDSARLLRDLPPALPRSALGRFQLKQLLNASAGQVIYAPWQADWTGALPSAEHAPHACNGHGHFVPAVPLDMAGAEGEYWFSGATYVDSADAQAANTAADEAANVQRLRELLPAFADTLAQQVRQGQIRRFVGVRCTTPTRLPKVQALAPGLWLCAGFGSRGLSHAPLAAEFLAAQIGS